MYILKLPKLVPVVEMCCPFYLFYMFSRLNGLLRAIAICKIALFPSSPLLATFIVWNRKERRDVWDFMFIARYLSTHIYPKSFKA